MIDIVTDVEDKYDVVQHTIMADTPGMEKLMEEYLAYKQGYMQDPVPYVDGQCIISRCIYLCCN